MRVFGITGGIGMGKSTVADFLVSRGELLIDTDQIARTVVAPGQPALAEIRAAFGPALILEGETLDRRALAQLVFADAEARSRLETILHPRIRRIWREQIQSWAANGAARAFVVIPLLFETTAESEFDAVLCIGCSAATQRQRLLQRGWAVDHLEMRISAQLPIGTKMDRSDGVIWNESTIELCREQCARLLETVASAKNRID